MLLDADGLCKGRVLRRLEILLSKAARKGLAVTALVQRGAAEMLEHGDDAQRAELVSSFREPSVRVGAPHGAHHGAHHPPPQTSPPPPAAAAPRSVLLTALTTHRPELTTALTCPPPYAARLPV